jgi:hypothetical protein
MYYVEANKSEFLFLQFFFEFLRYFKVPYYEAARSGKLQSERYRDSVKKGAAAEHSMCDAILA